MIDLDQAHALKILHGLADGWTAYSVALHELAFGRKKISGSEVFGLDHGKQPALNKLRQLRPQNGIPLGRGVSL
jgi:hypothetical protein